MKTPRHFIDLTDLSEAELRAVLRSAVALKRRPAAHRPLAGKVVALVFQKPSMRTRVAFEVAVLRLGGSVITLDQEAIQLGEREPVKDVARVLSRYVDGIVLRTFGHQNVEEFAQHSRVPVINGLSDFSHPCQALADLLTMQEQLGRLKGARVAYVGDGNNVLHSLAQGCALLGVHLAVATPERYRPERSVWEAAVAAGRRRGAVLRCVTDPAEAVSGADVIYTDVWVSMGQETQREQKLRTFRPYQVNGALVRRAKPGCKIMHCLPAHRGEEITDEVMESAGSIVFDQAENRLHVQKALLEFLLGRPAAGRVAVGRTRGTR